MLLLRGKATSQAKRGGARCMEGSPTGDACLSAVRMRAESL